MLVVRIGESADHQFHAFLLLGVLAFFVLFRFGMQNHIGRVFLIGLGIHAALFDGLSSRPFSAILTQGIAVEHMTYRPDETWLKSGPSRLWHAEVQHLAQGQRRSVTDLNPQQYLSYFSEEPSDQETIASLWVVPTGHLRHQCSSPR